tara:strand:- start:4153 stop:4893 length:741 start_codon:yes stop_codon:yes gene_type:complete
MMVSDTKKVVLVTGGSRGIGKSICALLADNNYFVVCNYINSKTEAEKLASNHDNIVTQKFDVSNYEDTVNSITDIENNYGPISVLINNAGITKDRFIHKMSVDEWDQVLKANLYSAFNCTRSILPNMRNKNFGRIICLSSVNALKGQVGQANYCASKAALSGFIKAIALENASKNITANLVAPGYIDTDMTKKISKEICDDIKTKIPMNRFGQPNEIAKTILFLVDEATSYITGETISINGGMYMN